MPLPKTAAAGMPEEMRFRRKQTPVQLTPEEAQQKHEDKVVEEKAAVGSHIVYKAILKEADEELSRSSPALAWSGLAAGLSMGFSLVAEGLLHTHLPDANWRPLVSKFGYSIGFLIVILGRQQLFTENTLTPMLPLMQRRDWATFKNVGRLWSIVLPTNLIGTAIFAYVLQRCSAFAPEAKQSFLELGLQATGRSASQLFTGGIFAGWLIALMVWLLPVAETGRIWVILLLTYVVGLGGLSHVIAGSVEAIYTVAAGKHTWVYFFGDYLLPTLLGNCVGGVAMVAALNYAQVQAGTDLPPAPRRHDRA